MLRVKTINKIKYYHNSHCYAFLCFPIFILIGFNATMLISFLDFLGNHRHILIPKVFTTLMLISFLITVVNYFVNKLYEKK